jgi:hypothetical protein
MFQNLVSHDISYKIFRTFSVSYVYVNTMLTFYCAGGKIENNEMGAACGAHGEREGCAQGSGKET